MNEGVIVMMVVFFCFWVGGGYVVGRVGRGADELCKRGRRRQTRRDKTRGAEGGTDLDAVEAGQELAHIIGGGHQQLHALARHGQHTHLLMWIGFVLGVE